MEDTVIPEPGLDRLRQWAEGKNNRIPEAARDQIRYELEVTARTVTLVECRPPWNPDLSSDWTRLPVARFRYTMDLELWSLYWADRNSKFHEYDLIEPSSDIEDLIAEVERDPTSIFWG